jgi:2,4-dienoyl-CoA reductase-like NADH-dependent reductase (Old Yellow Enzyme family)
MSAVLQQRLLDPLLAPARLQSLALANRMVVAPMTRISASHEGHATDEMSRYYARFVAGGFGLIISEGTYTDRAWSQGYANQPGLSDIDQARAWRRVTDAIRARDGRIIAQLMHAGALSQANRFRIGTAAPSPVPPIGRQMVAYRGQGPYATPRQMSEQEIAEAIDGFAHAAVLALEVAGFDGVEIHGANGYLLDQFFTDYTNRRQDSWGGSIERRAQLTIEVVRTVRAAIGESALLGVRISQSKVNDPLHRWAQPDLTARTIFAGVADAGASYIHVTEADALQPASLTGGSTLIQLAHRAAPGLPIIANGGLQEPARALAALEHGASLIALGRGALANPDWPRRVGYGDQPLELDPALLAPYANIKACEQE